jgi:hypothetical protein
MRLRFPLLCLSLLACGAARAASSFSTDATDLWWNPQESGWGLNVVQQGPTIFATLFVYGLGQESHWYVASELGAQGAAASTMTFSGPLYESTGPVYYATFDPANVTRRTVGAMTFLYTPPNRARLTYTVDGVSVAKDLERQTWRANDMSGQYGVITTVQKVGSCGAGSTPEVSGSSLAISQSGTDVSMSDTNMSGAPLCTYAGSYDQTGRLGSVTGTATCQGIATPFQYANIEVGVHGFIASYSGRSAGCDLVGQIVGVRSTVAAQ